MQIRNIPCNSGTAAAMLAAEVTPDVPNREDFDYPITMAPWRSDGRGRSRSDRRIRAVPHDREDERDNTAAAPITMPTMLMTAEGLLPFTPSTVQPRMSRITRAVEVPASGHWLPEENPEFVTAELLTFFGGGAAR